MGAGPFADVYANGSYSLNLGGRSWADIRPEPGPALARQEICYETRTTGMLKNECLCLCSFADTLR
jgi:hypothetical protein